MAIVNSSGYAHVRLTVTDIARSKAFYDAVFGWPTLVDASDRIDEPGITESQAAAGFSRWRSMAKAPAVTGPAAKPLPVSRLAACPPNHSNKPPPLANRTAPITAQSRSAERF